MTVAPVAYGQSCLLTACSQHDSWTSVEERLGNHEVTPGGGHGRIDKGGFLAKLLLGYDRPVAYKTG